MRAATPENVAKAAEPLRDIALISQKMYEALTLLPQFDFSYERKGLLEIFQTDAGAAHAAHTVHQAHELGLSDTILLNYEELQALEPQTKLNAKGAIHFKCDAHLYPNKLMEQMIAHLKQVGVQIKTGELVTGFENKEGKISKVITDSSVYDADTVVLATGSWSRELAAKMQVSIPLMPGRGYSVTLENSQYHINYPAVLIEGRVALTPMDGNKIRFGGTMEITATNTPPRIERVEGLLAAVKRFYPDFEVPVPTIDKVWFGFRPCSADGLPYLGRTSKWKNVVMATGHSMLGLSLGAGTGKIVSEIVNEETLSMNITAFNPNRFD